MLTYADVQSIKEILEERIKPLDKKIDRIENNVDKILKIVTRVDQEHTITKTKVNKHEKRIAKVETKLKVKSPASTSVVA